MTYPHPVVAALVARRYALELSQAAVAARMGVPPTTIAQWESGRVRPPLFKVEAYARAVGLRLELVPAEAEQNEEARLLREAS